jgi:predicted amidophosphoribosyltransferase
VRRCAECSGRRLAFASARAAVVYDERVRAFVRQWKERGRRTLAEHASDLVVEVVPRPDTDAIAFVPGDPERARDRGDVPPRGLARALASHWELPVVDVLRRQRALPRQRGLTLVDRRRNVRDSVRAVAQVPRRLVLVDDIYTSGATANASATALKRAGASRVEVVTLARAVR